MARPLARRAHAGLPEWVPPQLTELVDAAPEGDPWLHEIKFDGYRMHARLDRGAVKLLTGTGLDWTHKYSAIATAVASLPSPGPRPWFVADSALEEQGFELAVPLGENGATRLPRKEMPN